MKARYYRYLSIRQENTFALDLSIDKYVRSDINTVSTSHSICLNHVIVLWDVYGECKNYNVLRGHKNAVLEVKWPTESTIVSCSADKTVAIWNANTGSTMNISSNFKLICTYSGTRIRKLTEHTGVINSCDVSREDSNIIASASDDCTGYHKFLIFENWKSNYWWYSLQWFYGMQGCIESLFAACIMTIKFAVFASPLMVNISLVEESTT